MDNRHNKWKRWFSGCLPAAAAALILIASLYIGDMVGLSDNADFTRVMTPNRITYETGARIPFEFENRFKLSFDGAGRLEKLYNSLFTLSRPYVTTHHIFIKASILLNLAANTLSGTGYEVYNIGWLGAIYSIFLVLALGLIFFKVRTGNKWLDALLFILVILMFCDNAYTAYFNSFYGEAVQYASFLFIFACAAAIVFSPKPGVLFCLFYYAGVAVFMGSKFANIPLGVVFAAAGLSFMLLKGSGRAFKAAAAAGFILVSALSVYFYTSVPEWMDQHTTYQAVFFGVLKDSPEPGRDLQQLGLPSYMEDLQNTNYYMKEHKIDIHSDAFKNDFYSHISKFKVLEFYLKNPGRLWKKLDISCKNSAHIQPPYLSNYGAGRERMSTSSKFNAWSRLRLGLPLNNIYFILFLFILAFLILLFEFRNACSSKSRDNRKIAACIFYAALIAVTAINLVIPIVTNGEADLAKHMFAFVTGIDLIFLSVLLWFIHRLSRMISGIGSPARAVGIITAAALLLALPAGLSAILSPREGNRGGNVECLAPGDYVRFGEYNGKELLWRIVHTDDNGILLFADEAVDFRPFDINPGKGDANRLKYGSNYWPESSIRKWLNKDFLKDFNDNETALIKSFRNRVLLSVYDTEKAEGGHNDFFWTHVPSLVDSGFDDAYHVFVDDRVFLPDARQFRQYLSDRGFPSARRYSCWLETIYFANSSMVRVVGADGYVYMKDAAAGKVGVRPALYIDSGAAAAGGHGSGKDPYRIGTGG